MKQTSVPIQGIKVFPFYSRTELLEVVAQEPKILIAINAEKLLHSSEDLKRIINSNIGYADGIGATLALHKKGFKKAIKIPGCELWLNIVKYFYYTKTFYLLGSTQEVITDTVFKLQQNFPGIQIVGYRNGFLKTDIEKEKVLQEICDKKPDVVFVAMGSPKQELLMEEMQSRHWAIYQGLGGSFDVYTGKLKRAPQFWINLRLEWFYRLLLEPKRIRRQIHLVRFFWLLLIHKI
ncbi:MAG: WecB/TagA/CpsF family glycosyltransferase [Salinivirgaceae bacterium]|nr:WecB/TagA/CpsF family glycosyltransferase [Salinivirgaceae bacterium]